MLVMEPMSSAPHDGWILGYRDGIYPAWVVVRWWTISFRAGMTIFAGWVDQNYSGVLGLTHWSPLPKHVM